MRNKYKIFNIFVLFFVFLFIAVSGYSESYTLLNKFNEGESLFLSLQSHVKGTSTVEGKKGPTSREMQSVIIFRTDKTDAGTAMISKYLADLELTDPDRRFPPFSLKTLMNMDINFASGTVDYDKLESLRVAKIKMNPQGEVLENQPLKGVLSSNSINFQEGEKAVTERRPWIVFPSHPIVAGTTWEESVKAPIPVTNGTVNSIQVYKLEDVKEENGEKIAKISYTTKLDAKNMEYQPPMVKGQKAFLSIHMKYNQYLINGTGTLVFNMTKGYITQFDSISEMNIDMESLADMSDTKLPRSHNIMNVKTQTNGNVSKSIPERLVKKESQEPKFNEK